jgi:hypothetical protein
VACFRLPHFTFSFAHCGGVQGWRCARRYPRGPSRVVLVSCWFPCCVSFWFRVGSGLCVRFRFVLVPCWFPVVFRLVLCWFCFVCFVLGVCWFRVCSVQVPCLVFSGFVFVLFSFRVCSVQALCWFCSGFVFVLVRVGSVVGSCVGRGPLAKHKGLVSPPTATLKSARHLGSAVSHRDTP